MNAVNDSFLSGADNGVLRLITAGSVDDGKSTLIGRLLYDSKGVFADQLDAIARAKYKRVAGDGIDFALLTDGLEAEREQGITIDVAYRYFSTPLRKFIVADAPGHEQYTRNMVTGASTADAAIILIDATRAADGRLLPQTKRHSTIARLLGIRHIVVAINKMDLVGWDRAVFERIRDAYAELARRLDIAQFHVLPLSALEGDNVVNPSARTPWYDGPPLLSLLEQLGQAEAEAAPSQPLRFPVQWVARHGGASADDFRGYAGRVASGVLRPGDEIVIQPSGVTARVQQVLAFDHEVQEAVAGDSVTVVLDRDVDVSRGDVLSHAAAPARVGREFEAELCWLDAQALNPARKYLLKHGTRLTSAKIRDVLTQRDIHELQEVDNASGALAMNEIGRVTLTTREALAVDRYADAPATGAFILIDEATHQTAAAGMLR
ncbi:sulfate adenylyltransferase subunit 1 [Bordetella petrii]|uniref:sulfate adenylyltransferase n=1 Tax=Bordetella petrii (strain ATCC BAA-461 / DSM 12804 / CCUG 43448 / CIP 107267 / Se-1111R) TaxID=340100 RepID=A9IJM4_BORPD|nr:GTP-binding protein [Bordetella petrii]CAP42249.1 sulfate adenylyltransferase subunit 1 [Bordetella petrii]